MSILKRIPIKYVRDRAKSRYPKEALCYICEVDGSLDYHHFFTVDILFDNWLKDNKIIVNSAEDIYAVRDDFIESHSYEMFEYGVTLCKTCHKRLHTVYSQRPALATAPKQKRWADIQRNKKCQKKDCGLD